MMTEDKETYLNMSDEASADDFRREDFEPAYVERADRYAEEHRLPKFDEVGGIDRAIELTGGWE